MKEEDFSLRKWCSNQPQLLHNIPQGGVEVKRVLKQKVLHYQNVRTCLATKWWLFDLLGILSLIVTTAKIFIQELWELKLDWDQSLPESLCTEWITFRSQVDVLKTLQVSRHIFKGRFPKFYEHIFINASERAHVAAAYLRPVFEDGTNTTELLCAKSRVASLKQQTIPRNYV